MSRRGRAAWLIDFGAMPRGYLTASGVPIVDEVSNPGNYPSAAYRDAVYTSDDGYLATQPAPLPTSAWVGPPPLGDPDGFGTVTAHKKLKITDGIQIEMVGNYEGSLINIGQQLGGMVHADPSNADIHRRGIYFCNDITIGGNLAASGGLACYLHTAEQDPFTDPEGQLGLNFYGPNATHDLMHTLIKAVGGKVSGYVWNKINLNWDRLCGPITLATDCPAMAGVDGWGFWGCEGQADPGARTAIRFKISRCSDNLGTLPPAPTIIAGANVETASATSIDVPYPTTQAGDHIFAALVSGGAGHNAIGGFQGSGWTYVTSMGGASINAMTILRRNTRATGSESGTVNFTHATAGLQAGMIFVARNANPWQEGVLASSVYTNASNTVVGHTGTQVYGKNQVNVWIGSTTQTGTSITPPTGMGFTTIATGDPAGLGGYICIAAQTVDVGSGGRVATGAMNGVRSVAGASVASVLSIFPDPR